MKNAILIFLFSCMAISGFANHITGGEMYYTYLGTTSSGFHRYQVTLKLYRDCNAPPSSAQLDPSANIAVYNNGSGTIVWQGSVAMTQRIDQNLGSPSPCIQNPPVVCYQVGYYTFEVALAASTHGYTIAYQRCCRISGITNLIASSSAGATYTAQIPGTNALASGPVNNSARFLGKDTVIVCANNRFCYDWGAEDSDADSLSYAFCAAWLGGATGAPVPNPPLGPPYSSVTYSGGFSASLPLGGQVNINPVTGMMCGIAPAVGIYVVTVCVTEWRNGVPIAVQRKDLQIKVGDCNLVASVPIALDINGAIVPPDAAGCKSFTFNFRNNVPANPLIRTYYWEFGDGNTSTAAAPTHTYADTGTYRIKLHINRGDQCGDSSSTILRVFPGFNPGFTFSGVCLYAPTNFVDTTTTDYGVVNSWRWDFGKPNVLNDTSRQQNPSYTYGEAGVFNANLIVRTSKGCIDTVRKAINIIDKPPLNLAFRDTLICVADDVQLQASGNGVFSWTPAASLDNPNIRNPVADPPTTTRYTVQLNDNGCINTDTVRVRVINAVSVTAMRDTTICATDSVVLGANTNGLRYQWSPAAGMNDPTLLRPTVRPSATTTYQVRAFVGSCSAVDSVTVRLVPYPVANAGADVPICYKASTVLNGSITGSRFDWSPSNSLTGANTLQPTASPLVTTAYVLSAYDTLGCPKPGRDTVIVQVFPQINAFAGRDTAVVAGQPLQLLASGGNTYAWTPATSLNRSNIADPIAIYNGSFDSIRYLVYVGDENGCTDTAGITVRIFRTQPQIFVPTAFTPNGDGLNDVIRPIAVGITQIRYFRVYNRWGQLVFATTRNGHGWDGKVNGKDQGSGTFVWVAMGEDYSGKKVFAKGHVTLIR